MSTALYVNDFGCVPDGRFLTRASISAGSTTLTDRDGTLRVTDIGKHIAIPGAVDLVATISGLVRRTTVANASMTAGETVLTATFGPGEPRFQRTVHQGQRITVAGAGPGGSTLLTDVVAVHNGTTLELVDAASTTVTSTEAILNAPDRVALSDYARASVSELSVDLGDRTIGDGSMTVGQRALVSPTARFSSLDLGKVVTIQAAGLLVTTIQSFDQSTQATLAAPAQQSVTDGPADVWKTDSRPGLQSLLAALKHLDVEAAEIRFGAGVYDFTRMPLAPGAVPGAISLRGMKNLTLRGAGPGATILRLMPQQDLRNPDTHVVETRDCTNLTIRDLSVHGAYLTMAAVNEQMHGIQINEGSVEIVVQRVRVFQTAGDGIRFLGRGENVKKGIPANKVRNVWVDGCQLVQNKRTGVSFQRAVEFVSLRNCYIEMAAPSTDSCLDFEPTGNSAPTDVIIDSNFMVHRTPATAVSLSGISGPDPLVRVKFTNNIVVGGAIFCTDVDQLTIQNNIVLVPNFGRNRIPVQVQRGGNSILITGNLVVSDDTRTEAAISLGEVNQRQVTRALITNNLCFARSRNGIQCLSSDDVTIQGNMIVATGPCVEGIFVRSETSDIDNVSLRDNDVMAQGDGTWRTGIRVAATTPRQIHHVSVVGNSIRGATEGVHFSGPGFRQTPVCALNRIDAGVAAPLVGIDVLPEDSLIVGGATSRGGTAERSGGGRMIMGLNNPNGTVSGNVGDLFQRLDVPRADDEDAANLYVKTVGNGTNTGWKAVA